MDYKFTIFTPCFNSAKTISRVFDSMKAQTYSNWEWIIINDGSTDESDKVIKTLIQNFNSDKIRYFSQENLGKHQAWNRAIEIATGDMFIPADSDDSFVAETLEFFNKKMNDVAGDKFLESKYSGINVCTYNPIDMQLIGDEFPFDGIISNNIEMQYKYHIKGEKWGTIRCDLLKCRPFPKTTSHYYCESFLWFSLAADGYQTINFNKKIRAYYYERTSLCHDTSSRFDTSTVNMEISYYLWLILHVGNFIWQYSKFGYIQLYYKIIKLFIKKIISLFKQKHLR